MSGHDQTKVCVKNVMCFALMDIWWERDGMDIFCIYCVSVYGRIIMDILGSGCDFIRLDDGLLKQKLKRETCNNSFGHRYGRIRDLYFCWWLLVFNTMNTSANSQFFFSLPCRFHTLFLVFWPSKQIDARFPKAAHHIIIWRQNGDIGLHKLFQNFAIFAFYFLTLTITSKRTFTGDIIQASTSGINNNQRIEDAFVFFPSLFVSINWWLSPIETLVNVCNIG